MNEIKCDPQKDPEISNYKLTVGLLGASFGTKNLGVAALTCGTVASVYHTFPNGRIFLLDYGKEAGIYKVAHPRGIASVELINIRFSKRFYLNNNIAYLLFFALCLSLIPSRHLRVRLLQHNRVLKRILETDIVASIAGGDSFSDIYGLRRMLYVALPQILILFLKKPLILLPQTVGPFKGMLAKGIARYILRRSKKVYTRDPSSIEAIRKLTGRDHRRLAFSYDMGFALEPQIRTGRIPSWMPEHGEKIPLVGLNVSGLLYIGGYTRKNMFVIKAEYHRLINDLIYFFIQKHHASVMLVPHVFGTEKGGESDLIACRKIFDSTENRFQSHLHLLEEEYDQHEIKALIGRCGFFLGSRMHACIAALSQCVPTVGLSYSRKFHGVFESVGMEKLVIDIREFDTKSVIAAVGQAYQNREEIRTQLEAKIPIAKTSVLGLFSRISIESDQLENQEN